MEQNNHKKSPYDYMEEAVSRVEGLYIGIPGKYIPPSPTTMRTITGRVTEGYSPKRHQSDNRGDRISDYLVKNRALISNSEFDIILKALKDNNGYNLEICSRTENDDYKVAYAIIERLHYSIKYPKRRR